MAIQCEYCDLVMIRDPGTVELEVAHKQNLILHILYNHVLPALPPEKTNRDWNTRAR